MNYIPCIDILYIDLCQIVEMEERSTDVTDIEMSDDSEWIDNKHSTVWRSYYTVNIALNEYI